MSLKQEFELLRRVPLFAEIEPSRLKLLAFMSERVGFDPGRVIVRQGDPADAAYLIIDGEADICRNVSRPPHRRDARRQRDCRRDVDPERHAAQRDGARQGRLVALRIAKDPFMRMVREFPAWRCRSCRSWRTGLNDQQAARSGAARCTPCARARGRRR